MDITLGLYSTQFAKHSDNHRIPMAKSRLSMVVPAALGQRRMAQIEQNVEGRTSLWTQNSRLNIVLVSAFLNAVLAAPQLNPRDATIVVLENDFNGVEPWHWRYETSNGIQQEQFGTEGDGARLRGSFSWQPPDAGGATYSVTYEADENGYRPRVSGSGPLAVRPTPLPRPTELPFLQPSLGIGSNAALTLVG
ncbi:larval cuticle protein LCP-14-like isoform X2 [Schistocerca gregaria]|uniref:larval cuticle protein LCP-14-like isoform X2 n=1 Tax=Schistocerca gregaria TaxID=7010 RepID=UPI00211E2B58|nr:larval cuticle protein LCP-14-like isoform X2 [Schistocerca gregaria]